MSILSVDSGGEWFGSWATDKNLLTRERLTSEDALSKPRPRISHILVDATTT
jgi:hypothetical protein